MMYIPLYSFGEFFNGSLNHSKKVTANRQQKSVLPRVYNRLDTKNSHLRNSCGPFPKLCFVEQSPPCNFWSVFSKIRGNARNQRLPGLPIKVAGIFDKPLWASSIMKQKSHGDEQSLQGILNGRKYEYPPGN